MIMDIHLPRKLGTSGLFVNAIGFGTWPLSTMGRRSEQEGIKLLLAALDAGINFIDTADSYCIDENEFGYCERMIAKALKLRKQSTPVIIGTKGGCTRPDGGWGVNGRPTYLKKACEASLKALDVDCIDLYQLHAPDRAIPWQETIGALADLKKTGKVKHIGLSNVTLSDIQQAQKIVEIVSIQNQCSLFDLSSFSEIIPYCEKNNLTFFAYRPVGGPENGKHLILEHPVLIKIANECGKTPFQVALAWLLAKSPVIIPIPGATKISSVLSSAAVIQFVLDPKQLSELESLMK
ncbi:MAG TPA: aldo/keto reductase [Gammaproteobacteria bacterium]|nr:aldo/keto reductase [Gammaproteobacteria bacterium]